jgi:hypothetical protein
MSNKNPLLNAKQVAKRLNVSLRLAQRLMQEMRTIDVGAGGKNKFLRVREADFEAFIRQRTKEPESPAPELTVAQPKRRPKLTVYPPLIDGRIPNRRELRELQKVQQA